MRFCDAQVVVRRALIVVGWTQRRLEQDGSPAWFAEVGDDMADLAERALDYMDALPSWGRAASFVRVERSLLWAAARAGRLIEEIGESGRSEPRSTRVRTAMRTVERRLASLERAIERAEAQGIPCARPRIPTTDEIIGD
jgi:hypothetical protein